MLVVAEDLIHRPRIHGAPSPAALNDEPQFVDIDSSGTGGTDPGQTLLQRDPRGDGDRLASFSRQDSREPVRLGVLDVQSHVPP